MLSVQKRVINRKSKSRKSHLKTDWTICCVRESKEVITRFRECEKLSRRPILQLKSWYNCEVLPLNFKFLTEGISLCQGKRISNYKVRGTQEIVLTTYSAAWNWSKSWHTCGVLPFSVYRMRAIISRSWLQAPLEYKPYIFATASLIMSTKVVCIYVFHCWS